MMKRFIPISLLPKRYYILFLIILLNANVKGQEFGVSASFFMPKNGYFSTPISPISFRGIGVGIGDYMSVESGITLYRMSGLQMVGLPFESNKPLIGPTFTFMIPLELVFEFGSDSHIFQIKGGGFTFYSFDQKINEGNLDRALRIYKGWQVLNSEFTTESNIGFGILFGAEYIFYLNNNFGISIGGNYYIGRSDAPMNGTIAGGNMQLSSEVLQFPDSQVDYTGFEISVGLLFSN